MFSKMKIKIFSALLSLLASLVSSPAVWGEGEGYFVDGSDSLRAAVWQLGAFVLEAEGQAYSSRTLTVEGVPGLQPVTIMRSQTPASRFHPRGSKTR